MPAGKYKLTIASSALNDPSNGDLDVKNNASIAVTGAGSASTTIDANGVDRAFAVQLGSALSGLTIANGNAAAASSGFLAGGAIYSDGGLSVSWDVLFSHNSAGNGGAIYADSGVGSTLINPQCRYSTTFTLTRRPGNAKHGKLQATASFPGNRALAGSTSPSVTLRFG